MPGYGYDEDDEYGQEQNAPKALRDALKKAQDELKARDATIAELEASASDLASRLKTTSLRDALTDAKVDPKYARFAERDGVDPTPEAVKKWVEDNKDVYAFLAPKQTEPADAEPAEQADEIPDELRQQLEAGSTLESAGRPGNSVTVMEALNAVKPEQFKTEAELDAYIRSLGAPSAYEG